MKKNFQTVKPFSLPSPFSNILNNKDKQEPEMQTSSLRMLGDVYKPELEFMKTENGGGMVRKEKHQV